MKNGDREREGGMEWMGWEGKWRSVWDRYRISCVSALHDENELVYEGFLFSRLDARIRSSQEG